MIRKLPATLLLLLLLGGYSAFAQPCTTHPATSNANNTVFFNVQNTNAFAVNISSIDAIINTGAAGTYSFEVLYNTSPVNSNGAIWTQGMVGAGQNGWVSGGAGTVTLGAHTTPQTVLSSLNIVIPASVTYGFALSLTSSSTGFLQDYSLLTGSAVNTFSSGGVNILTGGNISWGTATLPATPASYPRGFRGCVNFQAASMCSTLATPTASAPSTGGCANSSFMLTATGATSGQGISYQWQKYNTTTTNWDAISGATNTQYTVAAGVSVVTQYRFITNCSAGGQSMSNTVTITPNAFYDCYCTSAALNVFDGEISNVTFGTLNNTSTCSVIAPGTGSLLNKYSNFKTLTPPQALKGAVIPISVAGNTCNDDGYDAFIKVFIDYNADGDFADANEQAYVSTLFQHGPGVIISGSITVPSNATTGVTGMRVVMVETGAAANVTACGTYGYGETEDYLVEIVAPTACAGTPTAGTVSGSSSVCKSTSFTLTTTGMTQGTGISYQWQKYNTTTTNWDAISGATNTFYTVSAGITVATSYRLRTTCSAGGAQAFTPTFAVALNSFLDCYCTSITSDANDGDIFNVTVGTINNTSDCFTTGGTGSTINRYSNYTSSVAAANLTQNGNYPISVTAGSCGGSYDAWIKVWIDFDHDGAFTTANELLYSGTTASGLYSPAGEIATGAIAIPLAATTGLTRMRVVLWQETNAANVLPCQNGMPYEYGETEDYLVNIQAAVACNGTPATATVSAPASVCAGTAFTMTASGYTQGLNITYKWQKYNTNTSAWDNINGASNTAYTVTSGITTSTNYRFVTTCANGNNQSQSAGSTVAISSFLNCYCASGAEFGDDEDILGVSFGTLISNSTCSTVAPGTGSTQNQYSNYTTLTTTNVSQGATVPFTIDVGTCGGDYDNWTKIFIDFNRDGDFDDQDEEAYSSPTETYGPHSEIGSVVIPATASAGTTRMRIVTVETALESDVEPCGIYGYGETEDYLLNILVATTCAMPTNLAVASIGSSTVNISWTAVSGAIGYEYAITNSSTAPASGTAVPGVSVTGASYTPGSATYYLHVRANCGSSTYSNWESKVFTIGNDATNAVLLSINGGCTGNPYSNASATQSSGEPFPNCNNSNTGSHTVWFRFAAPTSGAVRITTDIAPLGTLDDSRMALYSATSASSYATFTSLACDEDGGTEGSGYNSVLFATGLTSGTTYYVAVDGYSSGDVGTFCISVDEITTSMIATSGTCEDLQVLNHNNINYAGWSSLLTDGSVAGDAKLVALVRNASGTAGSNFSNTSDPASFNVHTGPVRQEASGMYYLDRNFKINNTVSVNTSNITFFMLNSEITALASAMGTPLTVSNLNVTKQSGSSGCEADFDVSNGTVSALIKTSSGTNGTVSWLTVNTTTFSNFYIMSGSVPLMVELGDIAATNMGSRNRINWNTLTEQAGDYFEIERSSDAKSYTKIGEVDGTGTGASYSYWDNTPVSGVNYYRLKMLDVSGRYTYSKDVMATVKDANVFSIEAYPNPVTEGTVTVKVYGGNGSNATVSILDITGKLISIVVVKDNITTIDMNGLVDGVYMLKYTDGVHSQTIKINKQ